LNTRNLPELSLTPSSRSWLNSPSKKPSLQHSPTKISHKYQATLASHIQTTTAS